MCFPLKKKINEKDYISYMGVSMDCHRGTCIR